MNVNNKKIIYTGDTNTLEPFLSYLKDVDELYVDVSKNGGVHLKFEDIVQNLRNIKNNKTDVYLMHIDDKNYVAEKCNNEFEIK